MKWLHERGDMEWELLRQPLVVHGPATSGGGPPGLRTLTLKRDEGYGIYAEFTGFLAYPGDSGLHARSQPRRVRFLRDGRVTFETEGTVTTVRGAHVIHERLTDSGNQGPERVKVAGLLKVRGVSRRRQGEAASITEWYLNGPRGWFLYPRGALRSRKDDYTRARDDERKDTDHDVLDTVASTMDHFRIDHGGLRVLVQQVHESFAPPWAHPVAIEYPRGSRLPDAEERVKIAEFMSFLVGRHLLKVGETHYDGQGHVVYEDANEPWGVSAKAACSQRAFPPVDIDSYDRQDPIIERVGRALLPKYLELADELDLGSTLWRYWSASTTPVGVDIPAYYGALQGLAERWSEKRLQKTNIPKQDFRPLLAELKKTLVAHVTSAVERLDPAKREDAANKLRNNLGNINRLSLNESFLSVFDLLQLPLGPTEHAAFDARHKSAHGAGPGDAGYERLITLGAAYWSILARMFLRILEYEGEYSDHSQPEETLRPLAEPLGPIDWVKIEDA